MNFTEAQVASFAMCPLLQPKVEPSPVEQVADRLLRWTLIEVFNGRLFEASALRARFVWYWNKDWEDKPREGDQYWIGPREARNVGKRIYDLQDAYKVIRPLQLYELDFAGHKVTGEYALIEKRTGHEAPLVLVPAHFRPRQYSQPDMLAVVRWLHARQTTEYMQIGTYHVPLFYNRPWRELHYHEPLVRRYVTHILGSMAADYRFPSPGHYCERCDGRPCQGVFRG